MNVTRMMLVMAVACFVAPALSSQHVSEVIELDFTRPTRSAPHGSWFTSRVDTTAQAYGTAGNLLSGNIVVRGKATPDYDANAYKVQYAGPFILNEETGETAIGIEWNYHEPILRVLGRYYGTVSRDPKSPMSNPEMDYSEPLEPGLVDIPDEPNAPLEWSDADQAFVEFGRPALAYLRAARALDGGLHDMSRDALMRAVIDWVLANAPEKTPQIDEPKTGPARLTTDFTNAALKGNEGRVLKAALRLGPGAAIELRRMAGEIQANGDKQAQLQAWVEFLEREFAVLKRGITACIEGSKAHDLDALQRGFPFSRENPDHWPMPERHLVFTYGLAAVPVLEMLAATRHDFAAKANWLIARIYREEARALAERLVAAREAGKFSATLFTEIGRASCRERV